MQVLIQHLYNSHRESENIGKGYVYIKKARVSATGNLEGTGKENMYMCILCQFVAFRQFLIEMHSVEAHASKFLLYSCDSCSEQFIVNFQTDLTKHMEKKHDTTKIRVSCTVVNYRGEEDAALIKEGLVCVVTTSVL